MAHATAAKAKSAANGAQGGGGRLWLALQLEHAAGARREVALGRRSPQILLGNGEYGGVLSLQERPADQGRDRGHELEHRGDRTATAPR
jgi:hypothetical protein